MRKSSRFSNSWKDVFTFSAGEKRGIYVLLIIILILAGAIWFYRYYPPAFPKRDATAFEKEVNEFLDKLEVNHCYNESLVRGLDYYTGIVFELLLLEGSKKSVILGGGRYDNLFRKLGGVNLPAAGFALGVDRLVDYLSSLNKNLG